MSRKEGRNDNILWVGDFKRGRAVWLFLCGDGSQVGCRRGILRRNRRSVIRLVNFLSTPQHGHSLGMLPEYDPLALWVLLRRARQLPRITLPNYLSKMTNLGLHISNHLILRLDEDILMLLHRFHHGFMFIHLKGLILRRVFIGWLVYGLGR